VAWLIEIGTRANWDHIESILPDGSIIAAHAQCGVQRCAADYDTTSTAQIVLDIPMEPDMLAKWVAYLESRTGAPYDMGAIVEFVTGVSSLHANADYICSALAILAFRHCGKIENPLAEGAHMFSPRDDVMVIATWPGVNVHPVEYRT
jgi:uncharacterized protein YycO